MVFGVLPAIPSASGLTPHGPILIDGDSEFTPGNGVTGGTGGPSDPYVIEGWDIDGGTFTGVRVQNTRSWFVVRDLVVRSTATGILFYNVTNGAVDNATVPTAGGDGIALEYSSDLSLSRSTVTGSSIRVSGVDRVTVADTRSDGLLLEDTRTATLSRNRFTRGLDVSGYGRTGFSTHTITGDNLANGKPIVYHRDCSGLDVDGATVGQLFVANCTDVRIASLSIAQMAFGVTVAFSNNVAILGNNLSSNSYGLKLYAVENATVDGNILSGNQYVGAYVSGPSFLRFSRNNVSLNGEVGVGVYYSRSNTELAGNEVFGNLNGVVIYDSTDVAVTYNNISGNGYTFPYGYGVGSWMGSTAIHVHHNNFVDNFHQATGDGVTWDDGYPNGGNYWSDYFGTDQCSGPAQDVCPDPDGIGDVPYAVDAARDQYPLMTPAALPPTDREPPATTVSLAGTTGKEGWYVSPVTVTLAANDGGSGTAGTRYRIDGGPWQTYSAPFAIATDGVHTVEFNSTDRAGNAEALQSIDVRVDTASPTLGERGPSGVLTRAEVTVHWAGEDTVSGLGRYEVSVDGGGFFSVGANTTLTVMFPDGEHRVRVRSVDVAGNSAEIEIAFRVDTNIFSPTGPYAGAPLFVGIGAVAAAIAGLSIWRWRQKARQKGREPPTKTNDSW